MMVQPSNPVCLAYKSEIDSTTYTPDQVESGSINTTLTCTRSVDYIKEVPE